jgi:hypothetical protein
LLFLFINYEAPWYHIGLIRNALGGGKSIWYSGNIPVGAQLKLPSWPLSDLGIASVLTWVEQRVHWSIFAILRLIFAWKIIFFVWVDTLHPHSNAWYIHVSLALQNGLPKRGLYQLGFTFSKYYILYFMILFHIVHFLH